MLEIISSGFAVALHKFSPNDFLNQAHWFDWVVIFFLVLGTVYGASKGLWREFVKLIWILIILFLVMEIYPKVAYFLTSAAGMQSNQSEAAGYLITLSLIFLSVLLIDSYLAKMMHSTVIAPVRIAGGIFFGFINVVLVIGLLVQAIHLWPFYAVKKLFQQGNTYYAYHTVDIVPTLYGIGRDRVDQFQLSRQDISKATDI